MGYCSITRKGKGQCVNNNLLNFDCMISMINLGSECFDLNDIINQVPEGTETYST